MSIEVIYPNMTNTKSAEKAYKQSLRKRVFNLRRLRDMKDSIKSVRAMAVNNDSSVQDALKKAYKAIDKAAKRGVIKANTAARKKSRLSKFVNLHIK